MHFHFFGSDALPGSSHPSRTLPGQRPLTTGGPPRCTRTVDGRREGGPSPPFVATRATRLVLTQTATPKTVLRVRLLGLKLVDQGPGPRLPGSEETNEGHMR